ncbi:MAG TPA: zinc ribbon domain-containing protein [Chthoniobacteraceae bacterium]|nr:zinc ribbon domain-containing protein [Chthoniobacteraceae bacterium]
MAEVSAMRKHPCPACGGDAEWSAAKKSLVCPFCGTVLPWDDGETPVGAQILEHDLEEALRNASRKGKGLKAEKQAVRCESCRAITLFDPDRVAQRCDFCGSPAIVPAEELTDLITPESVIPAEVPATQVRDLLRQWYGSRWFAPNRLKRAALTDTLKGIYLPYWTFDAHVDAQWTAQSGYYYYTTESYRDANGRMQTRQVRHVRWVPSSGELQHFFDDDLVPGTVGVHLPLLRRIEPFPTFNKLKPYEPAFVRGWVVERYQVDLREAARVSKQQMDAAIARLCAQQVPGDTHRALSVDSRYEGRTFKHILVPVWLGTYNYGRRSFQVIINGATAQIAGEYPRSWIKITFAVLAAIAVVLLILWASGEG